MILSAEKGVWKGEEVKQKYNKMRFSKFLFYNLMIKWSGHKSIIKEKIKRQMTLNQTLTIWKVN